MSPLAANGQTTAVSNAPVTAEIHQPLDVHGHFTAKVAFDLIFLVYGFSDPGQFVIRKVRDPAFGRNSDQIANFPRRGLADAINIGQRYDDPLSGRNINASNTRQGSFSLKLGKKQKFVSIGCPEEARL
jgi:hypothetical protein